MKYDVILANQNTERTNYAMVSIYFVKKYDT